MFLAVFASLFTSPRKRGEVDLRALASKSGEGAWTFCANIDAPSSGSQLRLLATFSPRAGRRKKGH